MNNIDEAKSNKPGQEFKAIRDGWGDGLAELGKQDERIVVLTADLKDSTRVERFAELFPERFIDCGVAEQNMMGIAAGLAAAGKIPFVSSYAVFSPGRNWEQLRLVCYSNLPVKVGGGHTGLTTGPDGATHQALEDIAITRVLPNLTVEAPGDYWGTYRTVIQAVKINGPVYIRLAKPKTPVFSGPDTKYIIGKPGVLADYGRETVIIGCGPILSECLTAAEQLKREGTGVMVVDNHAIKPMDKSAIIEAAQMCKAVVTVEDHQIAGGMASAVAEILARSFPVPIEFVGVNDSFGESGRPEELWGKYGMTAGDIAEAVKKVISRKSGG
jgi:transketolase